MGGSVYEQTMGHSTLKVPCIDMKKTAKLFDQLHALISKGMIDACHDISEGGIAVAVAEMCFGGNKGAILDCAPWKDTRLDNLLFNETAGCFVAEVSRDVYDHGHFDAIAHTVIGKTTDAPAIKVTNGKSVVWDVELERLRIAWQRPMKEVFNS